MNLLFVFFSFIYVYIVVSEDLYWHKLIMIYWYKFQEGSNYNEIYSISLIGWWKYEKLPEA